MIRRVTGILLILILLAAENPIILVNLGGAEEHQPTIVELDALVREIELGIPPEGPLSDREFLMPEGVSIEDVKNLWRCAAPFVSHGADDNDIRNAFESLRETVRLPDAVRIGNESFPIRYDKAYVERNGFGAVLIHIPIDVPLFNTLPACFHVYSRAIGGKQHLVYNVTETRWYRIRRRIEGLYNITYMDLETGETHSVLSSLGLGVYPEFGIAGGPSQRSFPSFLLKYFPEYANLTTIPPGTMIDFSRATPSFLVAVPGHYEDIDVLVPEHEEKFRVLFPAYDPVWLSGWLVEASLSSSNVETGDILEVSYVATPESINPEEQPLNATLTLHYPDGFEPLDDVQRVLNNTQTQGCFKLKAIAPGTYVLKLKLEGNAFFPGWPPPDEVTYTVNVVGPESPKLEVSLEGGEPFFKHVNITARLENKGAGEAFNTILEFSGEVEPLSLSVGSILSGETWSKVVTLRLRSEVASIRARAIFFDDSGNKYISEGFATVVSPAYVVPEHFEEYTLRVPEHFEKRRVFVPGYEGYTHVKIYHPYSAFEIPGSFTISGQGLILEAEGVKVYTSFLPIADEGFELRVIPKEVTLNIYGDVLVGPLIPVQGLQTIVPVKYMVKSVEPAFEEKLVREDEAKSTFNVSGCGELVALEGYEVTLASKRIVRKPLWVDTLTYRRLQQEGFDRIRYGCYWYEDGYREEWPSSDAVLELTPLERELYANRIILVYHPLQETPLESSLIRGIWLRNYATQDIDYTVTVESVTLPPGKSETATMKAEKACCKELSVLIFANTTFWVRLRKGDRLVAELFLPRVLSPPFPLSLQWWRGFILGLINRSDRIMVNMMMLGTVAMVPRELMPVIAVALLFLKAYQVYNQRGEIFNATVALRNLTAMGLIYSGMAAGYRLQGKHGFAALCDNLSQTFFEGAKEVAADLGLRLVMDVKLEDVKVALGWRKAGEYEQGYATGKIVGAMVEAVTYAATFATIYYEFSTARDILTSAGAAGRISASSVLRRFAQGLYAWVTPAIWDLAENTIKFGAWLKGKLTLPDVLRLIFAGQVSKDFGENVEKALKTLPDGGEPEAIAKRVSNIVNRVTLDSDIPESVGARILSILSKMGEEYVGREDAAETIIEAWKKVSKLDAWEKSNEPGKLLIDLLEDMGTKRAGETLNMLQKFIQLGDEELGNLGRVLIINPNTEILRLILEEPGRLDGIKNFDFATEPHEIIMKKGQPSMLTMGKGNELELGTYIVRIYWEHDGKSGIMEFAIVKNVKSDQVNIPVGEVNKALSEIGSEEAEISITTAEFSDYRLSFPMEFSISGAKVKLDLFNNEMEICGKIYRIKSSPDVWGGRIRVDAELNAKGIRGNILVLSFYQDGKIGVKYGEYSEPVEWIRIDEKLDWIEIGYKGDTAEYSFNLKPLSEQMSKHFYEILLEEGKDRVRLKEELFRLLGYNALKELEDGIGSKYGILVGYDNGKKAYTGSSELRIRVPEETSKIVWIKIVSIGVEGEKELPGLLHQIIEAKESGDLGKVRSQIGEAGECTVIGGEIEEINYKEDIVKAFSQKTGIPPTLLKDNVELEHLGKGGSKPDGVLKAKDDIIIDGKVVFKKGEVIAIIEMKSSVKAEEVTPESLCEKAMGEDGLKRYIDIEEYKNTKYGIAIGFVYDPEDILADIKPDTIKIEIVKMGDLG